MEQLNTYNKIYYQKCQKGELHKDEDLNTVCFDKECKQKGLICGVCEVIKNKLFF